MNFYTAVGLFKEEKVEDPLHKQVSPPETNLRIGAFEAAQTSFSFKYFFKPRRHY